MEPSPPVATPLGTVHEEKDDEHDLVVEELEEEPKGIEEAT